MVVGSGTLGLRWQNCLVVLSGLLVFRGGDCSGFAGLDWLLFAVSVCFVFVYWFLLWCFVSYMVFVLVVVLLDGLVCGAIGYSFVCFGFYDYVVWFVCVSVCFGVAVCRFADFAFWVLAGSSVWCVDCGF